MAVRFFRLIIEGTNLNKLNTIKNWIETKIDYNDLHDRVGGGEVFISNNINNLDIYTLSLDMYINKNVNINKYKDIIVNQFNSLNKSGLTNAKIIEYEDCTHDEPNPSPCVPIVRMAWGA